jgi:hypothetical protein
MSCTPEERLEIERACNERLMRNITAGDFQIHGLKWDTIIGAIQHMDTLAPRKTWEGQLEQLKERMVMEDALRKIAATPIEGVRGAERPQAIAQAALDQLALKGQQHD